MTRDPTVVLFENARPLVRENFPDERGFMATHGDVGEASRGLRCELRDLVEDEIVERGLEIHETVVVKVPEYKYIDPLVGEKQLSPASCVMNTSMDDFTEHVIVLDGWIFQRLPEHDQRDVIAHELCHAYTNEHYGQHEESNGFFQDTLSEVGAPFDGDELDVNPTSVSDLHPVNKTEIAVDVEVGPVKD